MAFLFQVSIFFTLLTTLGLPCLAEVKPSINISPISIVFLGDSLTEGYGVTKEAAYPTLLENKIKTELKREVTLVNASISGSTSAGAQERLAWVLKSSKPTHLFLALGANDGLRGIDPKSTESNLLKVIEFAKAKNIKVVLAGMRMPPNYGQDYTKRFHALFIKLSKRSQVIFIPFLLEGVAGNPKHNQTDGIHPNELGHQK